jgi:hypothetical protein
MIDITAICIAVVMPVSLTAITMYYRFRMQSLKQGKILSTEEIEAIKQLAKNNQDLQKRIENMELIMHDSKLLSADDKKLK